LSFSIYFLSVAVNLFDIKELAHLDSGPSEGLNMFMLEREREDSFDKKSEYSKVRYVDSHI
jgi:hypothetical protein